MMVSALLLLTHPAELPYLLHWTFSNRTQKTSLLHFGKVNKLQYLGGAGSPLQSGAAYSCIKPTQSMPTIVSSKGQSNIEAIKRYFCSEYACMMVAQAAGVDYERMIAERVQAADRAHCLFHAQRPVLLYDSY